ncbi:MAG: alpha/beta fold hydrolase [Myxococcota bacterium]|nr:alpha/beta fold hydrolase [Myxococcota bacterium]
MTSSWKNVNLHGHFWTIAPSVFGRVKRWSLGPERTIDVVFDDPVSGRISSHGRLFNPSRSKRLYVLVHGLGGRVESPYVRHAAHTLARTGQSILRVGLRGSDGAQPDIYHAGLSEDLVHMLRTPTVQAFDEVFVIGFSLGGHIALTVGSDKNAHLADGYISICAPFDLQACQVKLDRAPMNVYRRHCLQGLKRTIRSALNNAKKRGIDLPVQSGMIGRIRTIYAWDEAIVVPRFGFASVEDYYQTISVGPRLGRLTAPTLIVAARHDPMVPYASLEPYFAAAEADIITLDEGAHVGFPARQKTGQLRGLNLFDYIGQWSDAHAHGRRARTMD